MQLIPSDPDIETIVGRIADGSLDLQPDFQRGTVWSRPKQRLLIDSILRDWYVPPIHVVRTEDDEQVVLDGQQRLRAIQEFVNGVIAVDGKTEPFSEEIGKLGGLRYHQLPDRARRRFDRFTLRVFVLVDYELEEPYELFFRLNQPTTLTAAEKRNAFFGDARAQIKELAEYAESQGMTPERIGFSNARLAYEDVVSRFVWTLEAGTLAEKVTAARVTARYRQPKPFAGKVVETSRQALQMVFSLPALDEEDLRLNKATAHSWLLFVARAIYHEQSLNDLDRFFAWVERARNRRKHGAVPLGAKPATVLFPVLNDRATARVNDVTSVVLRDAILWILFADRHSRCRVKSISALSKSVRSLSGPHAVEATLLASAAEQGWERLR